ncbi:MAG TPA: CHAT domain-containing protein [Candidatus Krumholzibacteria bacterium]|nr:CHAT domain-containing protein [Candidatus Krumholzibacteria bacterium]
MPRATPARIPLALAWMVPALFLVAHQPVAQPRPVTAADSLSAVVEPLFAQALYDTILPVLPPVIRRAEATGDSLLLGRALTQRGRVALMRGRNADARRDIELGIRIAEAVRDTVGLMPAVHFKGFAYSMMGDYDEGLRWFERRLFLAQRTHAPIDEAWARTSIGYIYHRRNDNARARDEYTRAITLFRSAGADRFEITALIGLGRVESATGNERAAIRCYQRAWVVARQIGDRVNEMWAMNNLGALEFARGDLSRADQYQRRAFDLARELKYPSGIVIPAANIADRALELGDPETAEQILLETRRLCETQGAAEFLGMVDYRIAELHLQQGRSRAAAATLHRLVESNRLEPQHRDFVPIDLAVVLERSDSLEAAIDLLENHLRRHTNTMFDDAIAPMHMMLSRLYLRTNRPARALDSASRARVSSVASGRSRPVIAAMLQESVCLRALGRNGEATVVFDAAIDSLEAFRGGISTVEWREVFGQQVAGRVVDAAHVRLEYPAETPRAAREEAFFDAIQLVKTRALLDRITEPRFGANDAAQPRRIATLDDLQAVLQPGEILLDIHVGPSRSVMAVVTPDSLRLVELPGDGSPLAERVRLFRTLLASPDESLRREYPPERVAAMQRAIGHDVLGAVADIVSASSRVFVAPDGYIASIPFGTLIAGDSGEVLMAGRDVVEVPSASVLVLQRSVEPVTCVDHPNLVAISSAGEGLPGARDEVRELARRYGGTTQIASIAGAESFQEATRQCDVLHIAAHALVIDRSPWESGIRFDAAPAATADTVAIAATRRDDPQILPVADSLLIAKTFAGDPYVRAWQIAQLELPAKLAVLSACETASGRVTSGEGTLGMTAAFLSAGVPVVVSSLWAIDDRATAEMMRAFYRHLARREPVATALRLAQLELARSRSHPFFWAGFTVVGDGSMVVEIEERPTRLQPAFLSALAVGVFLVAAVIQRERRRRRLPSAVG